MTEAITSKNAIGEILERCPEAAKILLSFGVHCVGCHVSPFEALEDGFHCHGLGQAEIDEAVEKINAEIAKNAPATTDSTSSNESNQTALTLTITDKAAAKLKVLCKEHNKSALRIKVLPGGCSGYKYGLDLVDNEETIGPTDKEIQSKDVKIIISQESLEKINGAEVDYSDSLQGAGFKINNPNAERTCGCGESFR